MVLSKLSIKDLKINVKNYKLKVIVIKINHN